LNLKVQAGEVFGFLGPNGAGKTTTMNVLLGFVNPTGGSASLFGVDVREPIARQRIGYLPELTYYYKFLTAEEILRFYAKIFGITRAEADARIDRLMKLVELDHARKRPIKSYSKGMQQRVGLAQALINNPDLLILDEPTSGLDPNQLKDIRAMISEISKEKTVLLSSHILQEIEAICPRVVIINRGKLVADSDLAHLKEARLNRQQRVYAEFSLQVSQADLEKLEGIAGVTHEGNGWLLSASGEEDIRPVVFLYAAQNGNILLTLGERQPHFENIFQQLTSV
jgi:ABC-2 type transport system ATP-binding protein